MRAEEKSHSKLSASAAHRWIACPGSVKYAEEMPPQKTSWYAKVGTAAHLLAETCIALDMDAADCLDDPITVEEEGEDDERIIVDEDMAEAVQRYLDFVRAVTAGGAEFEIEKKLKLDHIHPALGGTCDYCSVHPDTKTLVVADYKHGQGVVVDPAWNPQLMIYALGALAATEAEIEQVRIVVVQPRAGGEPVRDWYINASELRQWGHDTLAHAAKRTEDSAAQLSAGGHCRFCPALAVCPAQAERAVEIAKTDFANPVLPKPEDLTPEDIARVMEVSDLLNTWAGQVKAYAQQRAESGMPIPGWKLVAKRSLRKWRDEAQAESALLAALGDGAYTRKLLSPAQAEKAGKAAGLGKTAFDAMWEKPDNGVVLAPETDKRVEVHAPALLDFADSMEMFQ